MTRRVPLVAWLSAEAISLTGTRVSMIAIPWLVLTTTGSAALTGVIGFAEMAPYVVAKVAAGPLIDRIGARRVSITCDAASLVVVGLVPLLHLAGLLTFSVLAPVVALAGALRGPGDGAKQAMIPALVASAGVPLERATGLASVVERLATTLGAAFAGGLVALTGPANALAVDAVSFGISAALIVLGTRSLAVSVVGAGERASVAQQGEERARLETPARTATTYLRQLKDGWDFLRRDQVLLGIVIMVGITNLLDQAFVGVLVPVWARHSGADAPGIGLLFACFGAGAVLGALIASAVGERMPRFATYVGCFLLAGVPRFLVLALPSPLWLVLAVSVAGGFGAGFINPILGAVIYERIPAALLGRVSSLNSALAWAGIPFGGVVGGLAVAGLGLAPAMLAVGGGYLVATLLPAVRTSFREFDLRRPLAATTE